MKKGFTLLEVIIAISILTVAVGGTFILVHQTLRAASLANSRLVAAYLAQEGAEIVRNFRDNNWLEQRENSTLSWKNGLGAGQYQVNYLDDALSAFADGYVSFADGEESKFQRRITIIEHGENMIEIKVRVFWQERGTEYSIETVQHLYDWQGYYETDNT